MPFLLIRPHYLAASGKTDIAGSSLSPPRVATVSIRLASRKTAIESRGSEFTYTAKGGRFIIIEHSYCQSSESVHSTNRYANRLAAATVRVTATAVKDTVV